MQELKNIPTEQLVAELLGREGVKKYTCDVFLENYRVTIRKAYSPQRQTEQVPPNCDVLVIARSTPLTAAPLPL